MLQRELLNQWWTRKEDAQLCDLAIAYSMKNVEELYQSWLHSTHLSHEFHNWDLKSFLYNLNLVSLSLASKFSLVSLALIITSSLALSKPCIEKYEPGIKEFNTTCV